jgi:hypothetical protein
VLLYFWTLVHVSFSSLHTFACTQLRVSSDQSLSHTAVHVCMVFHRLLSAPIRSGLAIALAWYLPGCDGAPTPTHPPTLQAHALLHRTTSPHLSCAPPPRYEAAACEGPYGKPLPIAIVACASCANLLQAGARFCGQCGLPSGNVPEEERYPWSV